MLSSQTSTCYGLLVKERANRMGSQFQSAFLPSELLLSAPKSCQGAVIPICCNVYILLCYMLINKVLCVFVRNYVLLSFSMSTTKS